MARNPQNSTGPLAESALALRELRRQGRRVRTHQVATPRRLKHIVAGFVRDQKRHLACQILVQDRLLHDTPQPMHVPGTLSDSRSLH
jgi:hypothetical protein